MEQIPRQFFAPWCAKLLFTEQGVIARSRPKAATWQSPKVSGAVRTRNCPNIHEIATPVCALVRNDIKLVNNNLAYDWFSVEHSFCQFISIVAQCQQKEGGILP